ncbi:EAL domain-containing protein [Pseudoalteromonas sp. BDTF-M6]|uniref:EAL domain-containing protein n=1 Tax=Pseudoalteromonas sp. BDTF-M6 TaxID=2796132 RepID=UPI001BB0B765|nr:EAL domain-containing protein [Pseudoalteromonas sp. BDTF-M6]MBS3797253.1 EAL domain-containing protein [Pseudoalteromonas sp. BDTF-M6]
MIGALVMVLINAILVWALMQERQSQLQQLETRLEQLGSVSEQVVSSALAPYGLSSKAQKGSFVMPVQFDLALSSGSLKVYSKPLWLQHSHWFIAINVLLLIFLWRTVHWLRETEWRSARALTRYGGQKKEAADKDTPPASANMLGVNQLHQSVFAIVYCQRLSSVASGIASLFEALLQEQLQHQQRVSVSILNSGCFAITVKEVAYKQLESHLQNFSAMALKCCRSLLPDLRRSEVKVGLCNYRSGADQAVVYQLCQSALALARQSEHKHCYRIPFSHNHSMLLAAKSCSLVDAINNEQFVCFFQPVFDLYNEEIIHHETLLRIRHPQLGLISPEYLLSHSTPESAARSVDIAVLRRLETMLKSEQLQADISLNIHPSSWLDDDFWRRLGEFLEQHPRVCLECPAALLAKQPRLIAKRLKSTPPCQRGVIVDQLSKWPTDALNTLKVPIKAIKLASELISHVDTDRHIQRRVLSYVANAQRLGITVYAVGIERHQQAEVLKQLGVQGAQGFYFTGTINQLSAFNLSQ